MCMYICVCALHHPLHDPPRSSTLPSGRILLSLVSCKDASSTTTVANIARRRSFPATIFLGCSVDTGNGTCFSVPSSSRGSSSRSSSTSTSTSRVVAGRSTSSSTSINGRCRHRHHTQQIPGLHRGFGLGHHPLVLVDPFVFPASARLAGQTAAVGGELRVSPETGPAGAQAAGGGTCTARGRGEGVSMG